MNPDQRSIEAEALLADDAPIDAPSRTVLVVEDNLDIREALKDLLTNEGYLVMCASDGTDALQMLRGGLQPRAILLDIMMRGMNGQRFHEEQRADPALAQIPIIVISANRNATKQAVVNGAIAGLNKPFRFDDLKRVLEECAIRES